VSGSSRLKIRFNPSLRTDAICVFAALALGAVLPPKTLMVSATPVAAATAMAATPATTARRRLET
jgi:hypothetical protein